MDDVWFLLTSSQLFHAMIAGAAGGLARTIALKQRSPMDILVNLIAGSVCGVFIGPLFAPWIRTLLGGGAVDGYQLQSQFMAGALGITFVGLAIDTIGKWMKADGKRNGNGGA